MTRRAALSPFLLLLALAGCASVRPSAPDPLDVYLLAGQSNMAGRGTIAAEDTATHPRVYALRADGAWGSARDPVHFDKPRVAGVGPALTFGRAMAEAQPNVRVGLVPGAVGGTSIRAWAPGAADAATNTHPYDDALARVRRVLGAQGGRVRGVLWTQGESDGGTATVDGHAAALEALVARLRADLDAPALPFVASKLPPFYVAAHPGAATVNAALDRLAARVPYVALVETDGLRDGGDGTHLDAASARELGRRFAAAMRRLR